MDLATLAVNITTTGGDEAARQLDAVGAKGINAGEALKSLHRDVALINADLRAGRLSQADYAASLAETRRQAQALSGSIGALSQREVASFNNLIDKTAVKVDGAGVSIRSLRGPLTTMATQFIGVNSSLGQFGSILGSLAIGSGPILGVIVAIGALGVAIKALKDDTGDAMKAWQAYLDTIRKQTPLALAGAALDEQTAKVVRLSRLVATSAPLSIQRENYERSLTDAVKEQAALQEHYNQILDAAQEKARDHIKVLNDQTAAWKKLTGAMIEAQQTAVEAATVPGFLQGQRRGQTNAFDPGTGFTSEIYDPNGRQYGSILLPARIRDGVTATRDLNNESKNVAENWQSASASIANAVTLLANGDDALSQWLATTVAVVGQVEDLSKKLAAPGGKLGATDVIGLAATGLSFFAGAFTETPGQRRSREIMEQNNARLSELKRSLDSSTLAITGTAYSTARGGVNALLGTSPGQFIKNLGGVNIDAVNAVLGGVGTNYADLKKFAEQLGITLDTRNVGDFIKSLEKMRDAINATALVTLKTFGGQLDLITRSNALTGAGPAQQLADLLKLIQSPAGAPVLGKLLGAFNLGTGSGRQGALDAILAQLDRARTGQLTTAELGGLTLQEYLNTLSQFGGLLKQMNDELQATVDSLREFGKSLALDQQLTILTPAQQLADARKRYEDLVTAARAGDQNAAAQLPAVARQFLELSRAYNASSPAYVADFLKVQRETEEIAKYYEGMLTTADATKKAAESTAANTATTVEQLEIIVAQNGEYYQRMIDQLEQARIEQAEQNRQIKAALEGAGL